MYKDIFIIAPYPTEENIKDGMIQRVKAIDNMLADSHRTYVNIALKNPIFKRIQHSEKITEFIINPIIPFALIFKFLLKAKNIYIHSIHPVKFLFYGFWFLSKKQNIILDAHGVVPEELELYGMDKKSKYMRLVEKLVFSKLSYCICVSDAMTNHFKARYNKYNIKYELLFTSELLEQPDEKDIIALSKELEILPSDTVFIYSGNVQLWQNIPMMMDCIKTLVGKPNIKIIILTGSKLEFQQIINEKSIETENITIRSVLPKQLALYYSLAHYGFVLRDDILVNRVANPTKMLEYLQFGIVPIVLSPNIGDYLRLGYEYLPVASLTKTVFAPHKSKKNILIAKDITDSKVNFDMNKIVN